MKKKRIIFLIVFLLLIMNNMVLAKYCINFDMSSSSDIAIPVIEISKEDDVEKTKKITASQASEFSLNISNFNNVKTSQVGQEYYLKFYSDDVDMSKLDITITKDNNNVELKNNNTKSMILNSNTKETHKYNVKIKSNTTTEILKGNVKVKLINEQIKPS